MRIALDARTVYAPRRRGTGKNLIDLYRMLLRIRPDWEVLAYHRSPRPDPDLLPARRVRPVRLEMIGDRVDAWGRWRLPVAAWRDGADLLHCPANLCPPRSPVPMVVTVHDLIPLDVPGSAGGRERRRFERSVRVAADGAARIICPSAYTAGRLVDAFGADPARITVNPWAADRAVQAVPPERWPPLLARYGVPRPFVLHLGAADPRKNTRRLLHAWSMLGSEVRRDWHLLVVGLDPHTQGALQQQVCLYGSADSVTLCGFAPEADMATLLSAASLLAYPSVSEGFGLPLLDAWTCGTPALAGDRTCVPEVAGDAALLVDPTDACAIAGGLAELLADQGARRELARRGRRRLLAFSWESTAARFADALESAAGAARLAQAA